MTSTQTASPNVDQAPVSAPIVESGSGLNTAPLSDPTRGRAPTRASEAAAEAPKVEASTLPSAPSWIFSQWQRVVDSSPYAGQPPSLKERVDYIKAGGWMPGDRAAWLENVGRAYGVIALVVSVVLRVVDWTIAKPSRLMVCIVIGFLLYLSI